MNDINALVFVPWWQRRVFWRHDHNTGEERDWRREKVATVGRMKRADDGRFLARCECGTLFVADHSRHVIHPENGAVGAL